MKTCTKAKRPLGKRLAFESLENRLLLSTTSTTNSTWAGYVIKTSTNAVSFVSGTWTMPTVKALPSGARMSTWVGIDGYGTSTVEQIGTEAIANGSSTLYRAWYEMCSSSSSTAAYINMTISPNDRICATVTYVTSGSNAGKFHLKLTNLTTSSVFSTYQSMPSGSTAKRSTAEWIVERPELNHVATKLANFGSQGFRNCIATISGTQGPISHWNNYRVNMVKNGTTLASTGSLTTSDGWSSFTVTYKSSGTVGRTSTSVSTAAVAETAVSDDAALTTLDDGAASVVTSADTTSTGLTLSYAWDQGLATFKLTDLVKEDSANLLAKKVHDATATDSVFASISEGNLLDINVL